MTFPISEKKEHFVCVFCPKYYTTISNVKKHIKTAHKFQNEVTAEHYRPCVKELKQTTRAKSVAAGLVKVKPTSFVTPLKASKKSKPKEKEVSKTHTVKATPGEPVVNNQSVSVMSDVTPLQPANIEKQLKVTKSRKAKQKSAKIKFYKGLENMLLDPSKNEKFQLWKKKAVNPTSDIESSCSNAVISQSISLTTQLTSDVSASTGYVSPKTVWLTASDGKGLKISGTWSLKNHVIYMDLTFSNKAKQAMHGFEIQLNENSFGLVPTQPLQLPVLNAGQIVDISLPMKFSGAVVETDPLATMKFIIRNSVDIFFIACIAPLHIFFTEDGAMDDATYLQTFEAIPAANEIKCTIENVIYTLDDISAKMQQNNVFTVAKCTLDGQDMIYQSLKLRNGISGLVKITMSSANQLTLSFKSLVMEIAQAVFQVYDTILEEGALESATVETNQSSAEIPEPVFEKQHQQQPFMETLQPVTMIHQENNLELREPSKRGKRALIPGANGRRRIRCGLKSCKPCLYNSDCGKCMQYLNKKTLK